MMREDDIKIDVCIRPLALSDAEACDAIIRSLPEFFGRAGGIAACAADVRSQQGLVAEHAGAVQAFLTWTSGYPASAEITWMAVRSGWRGRGIGRALIDRLVEGLRVSGIRMLAVKTASGHESREDDVYAATRAFYESCGFIPVMDLDIWEDDLALLLVRPLPTNNMVR